MKNRILYLILGIFLLSFLPSCGNDPGGSPVKVSSRVRDHEAYSLGEQHAAVILKVSDNESAVQEKLLDVRARITNISVRLGAQSAADYERGFINYIKENNDSIAGVLF